MEYHYVDSSDLRAVTTNGNNLVIVFHSGSTYEYVNAAKEYNNLLAAPSKGKYFHEHIKNNYTYQRVS